MGTTLLLGEFIQGELAADNGVATIDSAAADEELIAENVQSIDAITELVAGNLASQV